MVTEPRSEMGMLPRVLPRSDPMKLPGRHHRHLRRARARSARSARGRDVCYHHLLASLSDLHLPGDLRRRKLRFKAHLRWPSRRELWSSDDWLVGTIAANDEEYRPMRILALSLVLVSTACVESKSNLDESSPPDAGVAPCSDADAMTPAAPPPCDAGIGQPRRGVLDESKLGKSCTGDSGCGPNQRCVTYRRAVETSFGARCVDEAIRCEILQCPPGTECIGLMNTPQDIYCE